MPFFCKVLVLRAKNQHLQKNYPEYCLKRIAVDKPSPANMAGYGGFQVRDKDPKTHIFGSLHPTCKGI